MDAETQAAMAELRNLITAQRGEIDTLRQQQGLYDLNGLNLLRFRNLFPASGVGTNGTTNQASRSNHTH